MTCRLHQQQKRKAGHRGFRCYAPALKMAIVATLQWFDRRKAFLLAATTVAPGCDTSTMGLRGQAVGQDGRVEDESPRADGVLEVSAVVAATFQSDFLEVQRLMAERFVDPGSNRRGIVRTGPISFRFLILLKGGNVGRHIFQDRPTVQAYVLGRFAKLGQSLLQSVGIRQRFFGFGCGFSGHKFFVVSHRRPIAGNVDRCETAAGRVAAGP